MSIHFHTRWPVQRLRRSGLSGLAAVLCLASALPPAAAGEAATGAGAAQARAGESGVRRNAIATERIADAAAVAQTMSDTPALSELLSRARGVYILPSYSRAALGAGAEGGSGVLMTRHGDGKWGNPVFFNMGGISIGLQAGAEEGPIALLLMNQKAVDGFRKKNNFSLSADAGITVVNYKRMAQGTTAGDVVAWSGGKGLFGNAAAVAINDIRYNRRLTDAYYGKPLTAAQAIDSPTIDAKGDALRTALGGGR